MDRKRLQEFDNWFEDYVASFAFEDPELQRQIDLKRNHSRRVCREIAQIGAELGLDEKSLCLAETTALFHDVGRFAQYARYRTFVDRDSVNHALMGVEILRENAVLAGLEQPIQSLILKIIAFHNRASLPENETETCLFFSRLLRDADKLDIWRVLTGYYGQAPDQEKNTAIDLNLPDTPGISRQIYENLMAGRSIVFESIKNINDFKLLQAGWVYDINFLPTFRQLQKRGYLGILQQSLPKTQEVGQIFDAAAEYVEKQFASSSQTVRAANGLL